MNILLDECLDWRLGRELKGHQCRHVPKMGWAGNKNGRLLRLAEKHFDVFVTVDWNLPRQQHLADYNIAVIVLNVSSNSLRHCLLLVPKILSALTRVKKGEALFL
jgi:Domain of unknown function (DUF5615)